MRMNQIYDNADQSGAINLPADVGYWTAANKSNKPSFPGLYQSYNYPYPSKSNFTRLKDITLNYNLPELFVNKYGFSNFSVYLSGRNIHTWTPGWDGTRKRIINRCPLVRITTTRWWRLMCWV